MKKIALFLLIFVTTFAHADEGMFMPFMLKNNYKDMKAAGLELSYKKIYNEKKPSVKDAIVQMGGFCTAEIISPKGLMLTNHHCGYDAIREHSTPENDILTNGFFAMNYGEEKPVPGLTATVIVRMEDVTDQIKGLLKNNMDADTRKKIIKDKAKEIAEKAVDGTHYSAYVEEFYGGNEFYLIVEETFKDVRLVGAPPEAIGKYGGDTDNWMWTRHTGDFSMFRIYAGKDNKPAEFSMDNQPYKPKHHLPINIGGVEEGDFSFIMGFPGSTDRFLTSYGVEMAVEKDQPSRVKIRGKKLELMKNQMNQSTEVRLKYASTYAQVSNYWKYFIGQTEQLQKNDVLSKKKELEKQFTAWINEKPEDRAKYQDVLKNIEDAYKVLTETNPTTVYFFESIYSVGLNRFMISHYRLYKMLQMQAEDEDFDESQIEKMTTALAQQAEHQWETFDYNTEVNLVGNMLDMYYQDVPHDQHTKLLDSAALVKGGFMDLTKFHLKNSVFTDKNRYEEFLKNPTLSVLETDLIFLINIDLLDNFRKINYGTEVNEANEILDNANRLFIEAIREMNPDKQWYPNANFTLRLTYGNILPYSAQGKDYKHYTTIEGLMAKEDPNNPEFTVPARLKELYEKKDYGRYGQDGTLWINFLSNNDITGGNSGSPIMNSKGELIGCAFDGNWEAMSGDIFFEKDFQRTISCDIRYILFIVDKYAGATHLIDEMTIVE
ncbi:S46 family peptidase [Paracrocinitomix mangrovi]|uniref:S46 family peptidase n=1 Tax=Paracrocinitomix mangrovi TaxID=2862509 RepID=UPI001C8EE5A4|nr:S46 family peptidase [Paracrocinitomix mangrovi]UKN02409.1 S46 family peptidase [Paracrocinitomix mangrovi]